MSCQRILSLLSVYMDGEANPADSRMVEEHVAGCAECARELALLRNTARLLATIPDVETPAGLLEQLEVATIRRPSIWQRLGEAFGTVPAYGRWAAATTAMAAILLVILVSRPPQQAVNQPAYEPQPPAVATQPEVTPTPTLPTVSIAERPMTSRTRLARRPSGAVAEAPAENVVAKTTPAKPAREIESDEVETEAPVDEPAVAESPSEETITNVASAEPEPVKDVKEVKVVQAAPEPITRAQHEDSLAKLRSELATRNKNRKVQVKPDPIVGQKVSVALARIRF